MAVLVAVVREHGDSDMTSVPTDQEAREWAVGALYLVEDEVLPKGAPTPDWPALDRFARDNGWDLTHKEV